MNNLTDEAQHLYAQLKTQLGDPEASRSHFLQQVDAAVRHCEKALTALKACFDRYGPADTAEEIHFFKNIKPLFVGYLLYYNKLFVLHARWPAGGHAPGRDYLQQHLKRVRTFFDDHQEFYLYHRLRCTNQDLHYFVRGGRPAWVMPAEGYELLTDNFTTGFDMLLGNVLAFERLQGWLVDKLEELPDGNSAPRKTGPTLPWNKNKIDVVELSYALHFARVFDAPIKTIIGFFETHCGLDLHNYYDTFSDIKLRKTNPTSFLDELRLELLKKLRGEG